MQAAASFQLPSKDQKCGVGTAHLICSVGRPSPAAQRMVGTEARPTV